MSAMDAYWSDKEVSAAITLRHYDPDVDASWTIYEEADDSLQIIYRRDDLPNGDKEDFWLYLSPHSARIIGEILLAWGNARGRR